MYQIPSKMDYSFVNHRNKSKKFYTKYVGLLLLFFSMVIMFGMQTSMSVAIVAMTDMKSEDSSIVELDWDSNKKSLILGSLFFGILITQLPSVYVASAYSTNKLICLGFMLSGFLHILTPFIIKIGWVALVSSRVIEGLFQGCVMPCIHILLVRWISPLGRTRLGPLVLSGSQIGIVVAMSISGALAGSDLGWQSIFYVFGTTSILWAIIFYLVCLRISSVHLNTMVTSEMKMQEVPWLEIFSSVPVWSLIIVTCGQSWSFYILLTELPTYMKYILHFDIQQSAEFSAIPYSVMWILSLLIWWASDFAYRNRISIGIIRKTINTIAMCGPALSMIILCLVDTNDTTVAVILLTMMIALNAGVICAHQVNHMDLSQHFSGVVVSITYTMGNFFSLLAPIVCGFIVTETINVDQWKIVFYITALINFLTNLVFVLFGKVETQFWSDLYLSSTRYRDQACRISTITAAYSTTTLKDINMRIKNESSIDHELMEPSSNEENYSL